MKMRWALVLVVYVVVVIGTARHHPQYDADAQHCSSQVMMLGDC